MQLMRTHVKGASWASVLAFAVALSSMLAIAGIEAESAGAAPSCGGGNVCVYYESGFNGFNSQISCTTGIHEQYGESAYNNCPNRPANLLSGSAQNGWNVIACMNPGGERPNPGVIHAVEVLNVGERC